MHTICSLCAQQNEKNCTPDKAAAPSPPRKKRRMNIFLPSRYLLLSAWFSVPLCRGVSSSSALVARTDLLAAPLRCRLISGSSGAVGAAEGKREEGRGEVERRGGGLPGSKPAGWWWCSALGGATSSGTVPRAPGRRIAPRCSSCFGLCSCHAFMLVAPNPPHLPQGTSPPSILSNKTQCWHTGVNCVLVHCALVIALNCDMSLSFEKAMPLNVPSFFPLLCSLWFCCFLHLNCLKHGRQQRLHCDTLTCGAPWWVAHLHCMCVTKWLSGKSPCEPIPSSGKVSLTG